MAWIFRLVAFWCIVILCHFSSFSQADQTKDITKLYNIEETNRTHEIISYMPTLSSWLKHCFEVLPCHDHMTPIRFTTTEIEYYINGGQYNVREPRFSRSGIEWYQFKQLLTSVASILEEQLVQTDAWFDSYSLLPNGWNTTEFIRRTKFSNLYERTSLPGIPNTGVLLPYVLKLRFPSDSVVAVFGDLHGSVHSLLRELAALVQLGYLQDDFRVSQAWKNKFFILFLGDYVDRGAYGVETFATLLRIKVTNPNNVFFARGNHEDKHLNMPRAGGTFYEELSSKFHEISPKERDIVFNFYDLLPMAIFFTTQNYTYSNGTHINTPQFIQACHGGLEVGYNPKEFLSDLHDINFPKSMYMENKVQYRLSVISALMRKSWLESQSHLVRSNIPFQYHSLFHDYGPWSLNFISNSSSTLTWQSKQRLWPKEPIATDIANGFMWSDFFVHDMKTWFANTPGRGFVFGKALTEHFLQSIGVVAVLRAHQHNNNRIAGPMLSELKRHGGVFDNWESSGMVYTFLSGTECPGFDFHMDSFGLLHMEGKYDPSTWRLQQCRHAVGYQEISKHSSEKSDPLHVNHYMSQSLFDFNPTVNHACASERKNGMFFTCHELSWMKQGPRIPSGYREEATQICKSFSPTWINQSDPTMKTMDTTTVEPNQMLDDLPWLQDKQIFTLLILSPRLGSVQGDYTIQRDMSRYMTEKNDRNKLSFCTHSLSPDCIDISMQRIQQLIDTMTDFTHRSHQFGILSAISNVTNPRRLLQQVNMSHVLSPVPLKIAVDTLFNVHEQTLLNHNVGIKVQVYSADLADISGTTEVTTIPALTETFASECLPLTHMASNHWQTESNLFGLNTAMMYFIRAELVTQCESKSQTQMEVIAHNCTIFVTHGA